jgi:hypothetical protein
MSLNEMRTAMNSYWGRVYREDIESKGSFDSLAELDRLYHGFGEEERVLADEVLSEWIQSDREDKRFAAMHLVSRFEVKTAVPALERLARQLDEKDDPGAPFERDKAERITRELSEDHTSG